MRATAIQQAAPHLQRVVLVTDDEEQIARLCRMLLERAGYRVLSVNDGEAALALSRRYEGGIDVLFTDVDLPGISGIELAREIQKQRPSIGVLLASGNPDHAAQSGYAFLAKPFSGEGLRKAIAHVLPSISDSPGNISGLRDGAVADSGRLHLSGGQLEAYARNWLSEPELGICEEHLLICEQCRGALEQEEAFVFAMRSAARSFISSPVPAQVRTRWPLAVPVWTGAIAIVLMTSSFGLYRWSRRPTGDPEVVNLIATRGVPVETIADAGRPLVLNIQTDEAHDLAPYRVEMVDQNGKRIWQQQALARGPVVRARGAVTRPGVYFVRLYAAPDRLVGEYGIRIVKKR